MSSYNSRYSTPSGVCRPASPNIYGAHRPPTQRQFDCDEDQGPRQAGIQKEIGYIFEWDNGERLSPNVFCHLTVGGETTVYGLTDGKKLFCQVPPGKYEIQLLRNVNIEEKLNEARRQLKEALDAIIAHEREESAALQKIQDGRNAVSNYAHLKYKEVRDFLLTGWRHSKNLKEWTDLINPFNQLSNALTSAWNATSTDGESWTNSFIHNYSKAQKDELTQALGFDPEQIEPIHLAQAYEFTCFIYSDSPSKKLIANFLLEYIKSQNPEEIAEFSGAVLFEVVLGALLIYFTGGVGLVARAGQSISANVLELLKTIGETLIKIANLIKSATIKSASFAQGVTGKAAKTVRIPRPKEIIPEEIFSSKARETGGAARAAQYAKNWPEGDLDKTISKFSGPHPIISTTEKGKKIYKNPETGIEIVEDLKGNYFRIFDPSKPGRRKYLDLTGNVPNNKALPNGKQIGITQSEYNEITHFKKKIEK
jgi:hypothetical protein